MPAFARQAGSRHVSGKTPTPDGVLYGYHKYMPKSPAEVHRSPKDVPLKNKKKMAKRNPHCPVAGCRAKTLHVSSPTIAGIQQTFSKPETVAEWVKNSIFEFVHSVESDTGSNRYFAYLTRWRQPEELYHRASYVVFIAEKAEIPHIVSGELPNSFSAMWKKVNRAVYDGKGTLDEKRIGLRGEEFTTMD